MKAASSSVAVKDAYGLEKVTDAYDLHPDKLEEPTRDVNFGRLSFDPQGMTTLRHLPHRLSYQLAGRIALRRTQPQSEAEAQVHVAVARALKNDLDPAETFWQESIEMLRQKMQRDETTLRYADYGVGSPDSNPDRTVTRSISEVQAFSVPPHEGVALHALARELRPRNCLELGTCLGISSAYVASALDLNEHGSLTTLDGGKDLSRVASINFSRLGLRNTRFVTGRFDEMLPELLPEIAPVDMAYIDGHHDGAATRAYFEMILQHAAPYAVMVFDDIRWSRDMREAWRSIRTHPEVTAALDLYTFGICVTNNGSHPATGK
ncbi:MAG: class I SAM-dependent methyltransferase [Rhodothermales bacterium]|nr:class I SAM-dependent methyltransferase [Rhodothermales bacterium]